MGETQGEQIKTESMSAVMTSSEEASPSYLHRDTLRKPVRHHADNLHRQLQVGFQEHGVSSFGDFQKKATLGMVSSDELRHIASLAGKLDEIITTGEVPFDEEEFLEEITQVWEKWGTMRTENQAYREATEYMKMDMSVDFLADHVSLTPMTVLVQDRDFSQRMLVHLLEASNASVDFADDAGLFHAVVLNTACEDMPKEVLDTLTQEIDCNVLGPLSYLGLNFAGGTLILKGEAGDDVGWNMSDGRIIAEEVGKHAGECMRGGEIRIAANATDRLGEEMRGGKIFAFHARDRVGLNMYRGDIDVHEAGDNLGEGMKGGEIIVGSGGDYAGKRMENGTIRINFAGQYAGYHMKDGKLILNEAGDLLGDSMEAGTIEVKIAGYGVGDKSTGGEIWIGQDYNSLGTMRTGGDIYFKGEKIAT